MFEAMFTGPAKDETGVVHIADANKEDFKQLLRYVVRPRISRFSVFANLTASFIQAKRIGFLVDKPHMEV